MATTMMSTSEMLPMTYTPKTISTANRKSICPFCRTSFEGWGYNATLLDSEPQRFCSRLCFERTRLVRMRKTWVGKEKMLARRHPDLYEKIFGSMAPTEAKRLNEDMNPIALMNDETSMESEIHLDSPFTSLN